MHTHTYIYIYTHTRLFKQNAEVPFQHISKQESDFQVG